MVHRVCNASYWVGLSAEWEQACSIAWPSDVETACATEGGRVALSATDRAKSDEAYDLIALAIAAFEASPESNAFTSKFDSNFKGKSGLTQEERRGFALFKGQAKCARCHTVTAAGAKSLFTDFTFDNLGFPKNPENPVYLKNPAFVDRGLGGFLATQPEYAALASANDGKHKVPTLRNVDKRPSAAFVKAYGHNGYFKSLKSIVHFYNTRDMKPRCPDEFTTERDALSQGCWPAPEVAVNLLAPNNDPARPDIGNLGLTEAEEDDIVAFMRTLSDGYTAR